MLTKLVKILNNARIQGAVRQPSIIKWIERLNLGTIVNKLRKFNVWEF